MRISVPVRWLARIDLMSQSLQPFWAALRPGRLTGFHATRACNYGSFEAFNCAIRIDTAAWVARNGATITGC
jgi:hypothetical protein